MDQALNAQGTATSGREERNETTEQAKFSDVKGMLTWQKSGGRQFIPILFWINLTKNKTTKNRLWRKDYNGYSRITRGKVILKMRLAQAVEVQKEKNIILSSQWTGGGGQLREWDPERAGDMRFHPGETSNGTDRRVWRSKMFWSRVRATSRKT